MSADYHDQSCDSGEPEQMCGDCRAWERHDAAMEAAERERDER